MALPVKAFQCDTGSHCIPHCVGLLIRDHRPAFGRAAWSPGPCLRMPHAPFVKRDPDPMPPTRCIRDHVRGMAHHSFGRRGIIQQRVIFFFAEIGLGAAQHPVVVNRKMIHQLDVRPELGQQLVIPFGLDTFGKRPWLFQSDRNQLGGWVDMSQHGRIAAELFGILHRIVVAATAPAFITYAPQLNPEGIGRAICRPFARQCRAHRAIAVFQPVGKLLH